MVEVFPGDARAFKVRVGVAVLDAEDRLLLARQNNRPFWVLPGGTLEPGETLAQCAVREIKEEANLDIKLGPMFAVADFMGPRQVIDVVFTATLLGGSLERETTENIDDIGFFTRNQTLEMAVRPAEVFSRLLENWGGWVAPGAADVYLGAYGLA